MATLKQTHRDEITAIKLEYEEISLQRVDDALDRQTKEFDQKLLSYERQIADPKYGADAINQKIQLARNSKFGMLSQQVIEQVSSPYSTGFPEKDM